MLLAWSAGGEVELTESFRLSALNGKAAYDFCAHTTQSVFIVYSAPDYIFAAATRFHEREREREDHTTFEFATTRRFSIHPRTAGAAPGAPAVYM